MMFERRLVCRTLLRLTTCALTVCTTSAYSDGSSNQPPPSKQSVISHPVVLRDYDLEQAFWACDHVASTRGPDATPVDFCAAVYDELKHRKFGGDFTALLGWWRVNKLIEHDRLTKGIR
jgi:hypothetical protein